MYNISIRDNIPWFSTSTFIKLHNSLKKHQRKKSHYNHIIDLNFFSRRDEIDEQCNANAVIEIKIWIYWSESNSLIYFIYMYIYINWKMYWSERNFTGLRPEESETGTHREDFTCLKLFLMGYPFLSSIMTLGCVDTGYGLSPKSIN